MQVTTREAAVAPVSDGLRISESLAPVQQLRLCAPPWTECGSTASGTLGEKNGGSKIKQEKGCGS